MHYIAERSRSFLQSSKAAKRREQQKVEAQRDEEIYERLLIAFPAQKKYSECTNAKEGTRVCANNARREI